MLDGINGVQLDVGRTCVAVAVHPDGKYRLHVTGDDQFIQVAVFESSHEASVFVKLLGDGIEQVGAK